MGQDEVQAAAVYIRVSTEEQGEQGLSLEHQADVCKRFAEERGWAVFRVYEDRASGKTDRRDGFQRLIGDAKKMLFQAVIVFKVSRFGRDVLDTMFYERELRTVSVRVCSATEPFDETTSSGWFQKFLTQGLAEFDNRQKAEFVKGGMKKKVERGEWAWRAPLGYVNRREVSGAKQRRCWVELDTERAPLIRQAFELYATGEWSLQSLADELERRGFRTREEKVLRVQKLKDLLRNEFYIGIVSSPTFGVRAKGVHEPLITADLFDRAQTALLLRSRPTRRSKKPAHPLRGPVWCACGQRMTIEEHKGGRYVYLRCMSHADRKLPGCHRMGPRVEVVEGQLEEDVLPSLYVAPDDIDEVRDELLEVTAATEGEARAELESLSLRIAHGESRRQALLDLRLDGEISAEEHKAKKASLDREVAKLTVRSTELEDATRRRTVSVETVIGVANSLPDLWAAGGATDRSELLEIIFERLVVGEGRIISAVLREPFRMLERRGRPLPAPFLVDAPDGAAASETASRQADGGPTQLGA